MADETAISDGRNQHHNKDALALGSAECFDLMSLCFARTRVSVVIQINKPTHPFTDARSQLEPLGARRNLWHSGDTWIFRQLTVIGRKRNARQPQRPSPPTQDALSFLATATNGSGPYPIERKLELGQGRCPCWGVMN